MKIFKYDGSPDSCVEFVKAILPMIGHVTSFNVYMNEELVPDNYRKVPDISIEDGNRSDCSHTYHFIARDNREQEVWLSGCKCGFEGNETNATKDVLQVLGVKFDYGRLTWDKMIAETNVTPYYDLNMVVFKYQDSSKLNLDRRQKVSMKFNRAWEKWQAKTAFAILGSVHPLSQVEPERPEDYYFRSPYTTKHETEQYTTNNAIILKEPFSNFSDEMIEAIVKNIGYQYKADVQTRIYENK